MFKEDIVTKALRMLEEGAQIIRDEDPMNSEVEKLLNQLDVDLRKALDTTNELARVLGTEKASKFIRGYMDYHLAKLIHRGNEAGSIPWMRNQIEKS